MHCYSVSLLGKASSRRAEVCQCSADAACRGIITHQTQYQLGFSPSQALRVSGSTTGSGCKFSALMRASSRSWPVSCACDSLSGLGKDHGRPQLQKTALCARQAW